jgi:hypothetical protein
MPKTSASSPRPLTGSQFLRILSEGSVQVIRTLFRPSTLVQLRRLLKEGWGPAHRMLIQSHNTREITKLLDAGERITFVNSFPRSGNWWIRFLLSDVFQQNHGIITATGSADSAIRIVPDFYCELVANRDESIKTPGVLIKSHDDFGSLKGRFANNETRSAAFAACRHLCPYRAAADSLVSMFHVSKKVNYVQTKAGDDIDAFCLEYLPGWIKHIESHLDAARDGVSIYFVSYHDLLRDTEGTFSDMLAWLGAPYTPEIVERAVSNNRFSKVRTVEQDFQLQYKPLLRSGQDGSGHRELKPETFKAILESTQKLVAQADQHVVRQKAQRGQSAASEPPCAVSAVG